MNASQLMGTRQCSRDTLTSLVHNDIEPEGMKKPSFGANNVQSPAAPVLKGSPTLLSQLSNRSERLNLGHLQVGRLHSRLIQDCVLTVHKVEEAAHQEPA